MNQYKSTGSKAAITHVRTFWILLASPLASLMAPIKHCDSEFVSDNEEGEKGREMPHVLGDVLEVTSVLEPRSTSRDCERRPRGQLESWKTRKGESVL